MNQRDASDALPPPSIDAGPLPSPRRNGDTPDAAEDGDRVLTGVVALVDGATDAATVAKPADRGEQVYVDAWDAADREAAAASAKPKQSPMVLVRELVETLILALVIFVAVRAVVQNFRVEGQSMDPTYESSQYVLVNKALYARINLKELSKFIPFIHSNDTAHYLFRGPERGEVVVFHPPPPNPYDHDFIKRVIGLPGDHVQVKDGVVSVNGRALEEDYLHNVQTFCGGQYCDVTLGPDQYFVMGDNRTNSSDSRLWGPVPAANIIGKTWLIYLPVQDFGPAPNQKPQLVNISAPIGAGPGGSSSRPAPPARTRP